MKQLEELVLALLKVGLGKHIVSILIIFFSMILNRYFITKIFDYAIRYVKRTKNFIDDTLIRALERPLKLYITLNAIYYSLKIIDFDGLNVNSVTSDKLKKIFIVLVICSFLYNLALENSWLHSKMHKRTRNNTIIFPFISIIIRIVIIFITVSFIAKELGFTSFIAGLGISGIAFALMAQDAFSNLFGGIIIVLDRPFAIGDWIQTSQVEGIVEEITFRSTKIRTFPMAVATIPNSKLANENIINWSQRRLRRIHFKFTIQSNTEVVKIKKCINKIECSLKKHKKVDDNLIIVTLNELSIYGFGIFICFYTNELNYKSYEKLKEEVNLNIIDILRSEGIKLISLNLNIANVDNKIKDYEVNCNELESILNITEEERRY